VSVHIPVIHMVKDQMRQGTYSDRSPNPVFVITASIASMNH
jgi:hypothetical protein